MHILKASFQDRLISYLNSPRQVHKTGNAYFSFTFKNERNIEVDTIIGLLENPETKKNNIAVIATVIQNRGF